MVYEVKDPLVGWRWVFYKGSTLTHHRSPLTYTK